MKNARKFAIKTKINPQAWGFVPVFFLLLLFKPAWSAAAAEPVATTVTVTSIAPSPAYIDQQVEINVRVAALNPPGGVPTGLVEILSGQNRICTLTLDAAGLGICLLSFDTPATVPLKAIYLGQSSFLPAVSTEINLLVKNKHTPVVNILTHLPDPSTIDNPVNVAVRLTSDGPIPTGSTTVWRSNSGCTAPPAHTATDRCTIGLSAGAGSCSLTLTAPGDGYLCAAYGGDTFSFAAQADPKLHFVSDSNSFTLITEISPEPSVLGETVWVSFEVGSPDGDPMPTDMVRATSGALTCTATIAQGRCPLIFTTAHLHNVTAAYLGGTSQQPAPLANAALLEPSTSRVVIHRVNAPATDIVLSSNRVTSFSVAGDELMVIKAEDPNTDETHVFALAAGAGSEQNFLFRISGDKLLLRRRISDDYSRVSLRIRAVDSSGLTFEKAFTLKVFYDPMLPATGFAAGTITHLPFQPLGNRYQKFDSVILEIPALGVQTEITGVPNSDDGWNTTWLWNKVGWLNGTAFPGWQGNSVLAAHNYLPNGDPGPFARLHDLRWGDRVLVHAYGETSVYDVRSVETVSPDQSSVFDHEESPWLTLVTCKSFDENSGTYKLRVIVRAVRVEGQ